MASVQEESPKATEISEQSLHNAKACIQRGNYGRAFANFLLALKLKPSIKSEIREDFILATREWTEELVNANRIRDLFTCYSQACELFPECEGVLNNIGAQLFRLGYIDEAAQYIRKALKINPEFYAARENFENICGHLVERWHFRMLNDVIRNQAYQQSVQRAVDSGKTSILDIGAGTSLLSMLAVDSGARTVFACERSKTMYEVAKEVLTANGMADSVHLLNKCSTDLSVPVDIPYRVSLVVTETFDAGLFGEEVLSTLKHAWENLLLEPGLNTGNGPREASVIPAAAQVYVCAIECEAIWKQNRFMYPCVQALDCSSVDIMCETGVVAQEPYTTEDLNTVRGGYRKLSDVTPLLHVNFCDPKEINSMLTGVSETFTCPVTQSGRLDALAIWFDLHLDEITVVSTSPSTDNCWHQAIFPVVSRQDEGQKLNLCVKSGDSLELQYDCKDDKLIVRCIGVRRVSKVNGAKSNSSEKTGMPSSENLTRMFAPECEMETTCSVQNSAEGIQSLSLSSEPQSTGLSETIGNDTDLSKTRDCLNSCSRLNHFLPRNKVGSLNNISLNRLFCQALQHVNAELRKGNFSGGWDRVTLLELGHGFSPLGLQALKLGFDKLTLLGEPCDNVVKSENSDIVSELMSQNGIGSGRVQFLKSWLNELPEEEKVQCLLLDLVEPTGVLYQQVLEDLALMKVTCLASGGVVVPAGVSVYGVLIESLNLHKSSVVVGDDWTLGYRIADIINEFQMTTHVDIDLLTLSHRRLSEPIKLLDLQFNKTDTTALSEADSTVPSFLNEQREISVQATESGRLTAVVYWFDINLCDSVQLSTLNPGSHWRQAAVMIQNEILLSVGQTIKLEVMLKNSCVRIGVISPGRSEEVDS